MVAEAAPKKNTAAVALGRKGGKKGGPARAAKLTPEQRSAIARKAVQVRWDKAKDTIVPKAGKEVRVVNNAKIGRAPTQTSDRAVLKLLKQLKATDNPAEIRKLTDQLERVIFHKQYQTA